jgi:hypothetical protein
MGKYKKFIKFYIDNSSFLFEDGLRPAKSITRNIIYAVQPFVNYYLETRRISYKDVEISRNILKLNTSNVTSTTRDNIRNLEELQFITSNKKDPHLFKLTRNFIEFINSGLTLQEYIFQKLRSIKEISDISMFFNCILCTLREGIEYGEIINYPDSYDKFCRKVIDKEKRIKLCEKVYHLYGFHGKDKEFGEYTPNAIYRFVSTCCSLKLIKLDGNDEYGFTRYIIDNKGFELLDILENQLVVEEETKYVLPVEEKTQTLNEANVFEDIYDSIYLAELNNIQPDEILNTIDLPLPLVNDLQITKNKRDPKKGANAKKRAKYLCEVNKEHITFKGANGENYSEAHHLIPMNMQNKFFYSLDVEANIISLCPTCHNLLHHSINKVEKRKIIEKLYNERIERLKNCGIYIKLEDLIKVYNN